MPWFAAHIVMVLEPLEAQAGVALTVCENVVLFEASTSAEVWELAAARGRSDQTLDLTVNDKPGRVRFEGVLSVVSCEDDDRRPGHGTEVTYTERVFTDAAAISKYVDRLRRDQRDDRTADACE